MTDDTVTARLAEWEALVEGATEGPWEAGVEESMLGSFFTIRDSAGRQVFFRDGLTVTADAEFIAASRHMVPALLGFVREVREGHVSSQNTRGVGQVRDGEWTAYCEEDFEAWPCPIEEAAQKWIGGEE